MFAVYICLLLLGVATYPLLDPDLGWHLYLGKIEIESAAPAREFFGYNRLAELKIIDHEWLFNIIYYKVFDTSGYLGLAFFSFVILSSTVFLIVKIVDLHKVSPNAKIITLLIALLVFVDCYSVRMQIILYLGVAFLIFINKFYKKIHLRYIFYFFFFTLGVNLHGGFLLLSIIPVLLESEVFITSKRNWAKGAFLLAILVFIVALSSFLTPYGTTYPTIISEYLGDNLYRKTILEWLPIYSTPIDFLSILLISTLIFLFTINNYYKKIKINELFLVIFFLILSIQFRRFLPLLVIVSSPWTAGAIQDMSDSFEKTFENLKTILSILVLFIISATLFKNINFSSIGGAPFNNIAYPSAAAQFIADNKPNDGNMFNPYNWGGYLIWKNKNIPIFIDGRSPQTKINKEETIMGQYLKIYERNEYEIDNFLETNNITFLILQKNEKYLGNIDLMLFKLQKKPITDRNENFLALLNNSDKWKKVYEDELSLVFFKQAD